MHERILELLGYIRGEKVEDLFGELYEDLTDEEKIHYSSYNISIEIFTCGNCGNVFKIIQILCPEAKPYLIEDELHILTKVDNHYYDITGEVTDKERISKAVPIEEKNLEDFINNYAFCRRGPIL